MPEQQRSKNKVCKRIQLDNSLAVWRSGADHKARHFSHIDGVSIIVKGPQTIIEQELQAGYNKDNNLLGSV
jgi:hypothetical protein